MTKKSKEYWLKKLKGEINYVNTQKNEKAIDEFCEDIAQSMEVEHLRDSAENDVNGFNKIISFIKSSNNLFYQENKDIQKSLSQLDMSRYVEERRSKRQDMFVRGVLISLICINLLSLVVTLANG